MSSDFNFTVASWFLGNIHVKPISTHSEFSMSKIDGLFSNSFKNINLGVKEFVKPAMFGLLTDSFSNVWPFSWLKSPRLTQNTRSLQISLFRRPFFVKNFFFLTLIFEPLYFLKACPIFNKQMLPVFSKYNGFLWACRFLGKKFAF